MSNIDASGDWQAGNTGSTTSPKEAVKNAADSVKQQAQGFVADAKQKAVEQADQHKQTATRTLSDFADAIRKAGDELSQKDQSTASRLIGQAADGLESFSRSLSDKRPEELLDSVRDFGRRNPTAFVAGSVLVGLAIGRFLRSSSDGAAIGGGGGGYGLTAPGGAPATYTPSERSFASAGSTDLVDSGATSIGAPEGEITDSGARLAGGFEDDTLSTEGAEDGDDRDTARFRTPEV